MRAELRFHRKRCQSCHHLSDGGVEVPLVQNIFIKPQCRCHPPYPCRRSASLCVFRSRSPIQPRGAGEGIITGFTIEIQPAQGHEYFFRFAKFILLRKTRQPRFPPGARAEARSGCRQWKLVFMTVPYAARQGLNIACKNGKLSLYYPAKTAWGAHNATKQQPRAAPCAVELAGVKT